MLISRDYVAGFFDGEGCIGIYYRNKGSKCSRYKSGFKTPCWVRSVAILNTDLRVLKKIHKSLGYGTINKNRIGKKNIKDTFVLRFGSRGDINKFLTYILPKLETKKRQAQIMLREVNWDGKNTEAVAKKLKLFKKEGTNGFVS